MPRCLLLMTAVALSSAATYAQTARPAVAFAAQPLPAGFETPIAADFNGDGKLDAASISDANIVVSLGNGDGTFQTPSVYSQTCAPSALFVGDANGDGKLDLIAILSDPCNTNPLINVLLGNGDGTFQAALQTPVYSIEDISSTAIGDFNGDGRLDVAVMTFGGSSPGLILLGKGDGTFNNTGTGRFSAGLPEGGPVLIALDVNGDGKLDLMSANQNNTISVMLGNGGGGFQTPVVSTGSFTPAAVADYNGDGVPDVAYNPGIAGTLYVLLGKRDGTFGPPISVAAPATYSGDPVAGDFNGDGKIDLVSTVTATHKAGAIFDQEYSSSLVILPGKGDGTFGAPQPAGLAPAQPAMAADFSGGGLVDLAGSGFVFLPTTVLPSPSGVFFPPTLTAKTAAAKTITVQNIGSAQLNISQFGFTGAAAGDFAVADNTCTAGPIAPAGNCTVDVSFTPTAPGERSADLTITDDAVGSPQLAAVIGAATALHLVPAALDFGTVTVGTTSPDLVLRVVNTSAASVAIKSIAITGRDKGDYYQYNTCGTSLNPHATCSVIVQFIPTKKGSRNAGISIGQDSIYDASPKAAPLSGTGD
jgi:hypothetical protein